MRNYVSYLVSTNLASDCLCLSFISHFTSHLDSGHLVYLERTLLSSRWWFLTLPFEFGQVMKCVLKSYIQTIVGGISLTNHESYGTRESAVSLNAMGFCDTSHWEVLTHCGDLFLRSIVKFIFAHSKCNSYQRDDLSASLVCFLCDKRLHETTFVEAVFPQSRLALLGHWRSKIGFKTSLRWLLYSWKVISSYACLGVEDGVDRLAVIL